MVIYINITYRILLLAWRRRYNILVYIILLLLYIYIDMWYILRYILIRTGNRRPEALSEVAITRCVYAILHGVSFFFFFFPLFSCQGDFRSFPWLTVERRGMSTGKKRSTRRTERTFHRRCCSLFFVEPIYTALFEKTARNETMEEEEKKERNDRVSSSSFLFFPSFLLPSCFLPFFTLNELF